MPFDPDAYLAKKNKGGFDPDAYLATKQDLDASGAPMPPGMSRMPGSAEGPVEKDGILKKIAGVAEVPLAMGTGLLAIPGGAIKAGIESLPGTGVTPPGGYFTRAANAARQMTYSPRTQTGQDLTEGAGKALEQLNALGPEFGGYGSLLKGAALAGPAARMAARDTIGAGAKITGDAVRSGAQAVKAPVVSAIDTLKGTPAVAAREKALEATKGALAADSSQLGRTAVTKGKEASQGESVATAVQRNLDQMAERGGRPTLDQIGDTSRGALDTAFTKAEDARRATTGPLYAQAGEAAAARERDGARIDVSKVLPALDSLMAKTEQIPEVQAKIRNLMGAVTGAPAREAVVPPIGVGKVSSRITPPKVSAPREGLTYAQLDETAKYLKEVGYKGELHGVEGQVRRAALDAASQLDKAIATFVPEHAAAAAKYAEMSKPLETQATRIGRALATEGGIGGDAYSKIASQNLPQKLFGTRDGINMVVDAIAGGKQGAERVAAQKQVDQLVEHWIMEGARGSTGNTGAAAAKAIQTPQMAATLQAVPNVAKKVGAQFDSEARMARMGEQAAAGAKTAAGEAEIASKAKAKIDKAMAQAEVDLVHGSAKDAYNGYVAALRQSMAGDPARYQATIALIDRARTLQEKTDKARSLAKKFVYGAAVAGAGYEAGGLMQ